MTIGSFLRVGLVLLAWPLVAAEPAPGPFLRPGTLEVAKVLPPPPAMDSLAGRADLEVVLQVQAGRTAGQTTWAKFVEEDSVFRNERVLGSWFTKENLPVTAAFFARLDADVSALHTKALYPRKRPPYVDARVQPCVQVADTGAYPSGHSLRAWLWAALLTEIFPEQRAELEERARAVGWARVIGGAHFPTDTIGGKLVGEALAAELLKDPAVQAELQRCRAEISRFKVKKAA